MIGVVRSWPAKVPAGRAHVFDGLPRVVLDNHQYHPLAGLGDVIVIEWDLAVDRPQLDLFAAACRLEPGRVRVAPYLLYRGDTQFWAHRVNLPSGGSRPVEDDEPECHKFGFGLVYLPAALVDRYLESGWSVNFKDSDFCRWHHVNVAPTVPVVWGCRPAHLNYPIVKEY